MEGFVSMEDRKIEALREQVRESSANRWAQSGHGSKLGIVEPKTENCGGNSDPMNEARVHGRNQARETYGN